MLKFYKFSNLQAVSKILAEKITVRLEAGQSVLWLLSGGSAIDVAVQTAKDLSALNLNRLMVSLVDERYGSPGHQASNWQQLIAQGFKLTGAQLHPVLDGSSLEQTTENFNQFIKGAAINTPYKIALLGLGADGHTAGILPHSPALDSRQIVTVYRGPDYQRITLSPLGLQLMDEAIVFATGNSKAKALDDLTKNLSSNVQPAQIIKQIPQAAVYNDLKGETI
ncbi:6-phosphogluconolactonase [Candidatus Saccharibacteria bacterium]|nr:6-phosphogluconolactonase [Candidatus Saccharibacteria bacterium]